MPEISINNGFATALLTWAPQSAPRGFGRGVFSQSPGHHIFTNGLKLILIIITPSANK